MISPITKIIKQKTKRTSNSSFYFRQISTNKINIICYNKIGVINMKEAYLKSLQMIKRLQIKNENQYNELLKNYLLLNSESLKYISKRRNFKRINRLQEEVA